MLTFVFFGIVFSSAVWLIYAVRFVGESLSGMNLFDAGLLNVVLYTLFVCLPLFVLWAVFGFISQYVYNRMASRQLFRLFSQMKKNQEYSDLLARIMLETEQNIKNVFVLNRFDLLIADMNELLSELLLRERLASAEQVEGLWSKVQNGGRWSFGKVLIENYNRQSSFQKKIFDNAGNDTLLAGTIMEFCARYQTLVALLEKHDKERVLLNMIETGVFGRVFAILAPVADEIRRTREAFGPDEQLREPFVPVKEPPLVQPEHRQPVSEPVMPALKNVVSEKISCLVSRFMPPRKETETPAGDKDALSLALERSFGMPEESPSKEEPVFGAAEPQSQQYPDPLFDETPAPAAEDIPAATVSSAAENPAEIETMPQLDTQKTLENLKKEWQGTAMQSEASVKEQNDDLTYPFGGWTDAGNYQK